MKVILAGYNIDTEQLQNYTENYLFTPETIPAAYAKISKSKFEVNQLRKISYENIVNTRKFNKNIIFNMGHSSISEHAVFNIDILEISRLMVEEIENFRLCSYTERSQRYVLSNNKFFIPSEIENFGLKNNFIKIINKQNVFYQILFEKLKKFLKTQIKNTNKNFTIYIENLAKEDARYILSMATYTQLGMTINARNLLSMIERFISYDLQEANDLGINLYNTCKKIAPSLLKDDLINNQKSLTFFLKKNLNNLISGKIYKNIVQNSTPSVNLIWITNNPDKKLTIGILHTFLGYSIKNCIKIISSMEEENLKKFIIEIIKNLKLINSKLPREFELIDLHYEIIVTASCFAQFKRHRMMSILKQNYDCSLGIKIPESIKKVGMENSFKKIISDTEDLYNILETQKKGIGNYILTNAHQRRILIKINVRELYHMAVLRIQKHAQWDIKNIVQLMLNLACNAMPLTLANICKINKIT